MASATLSLRGEARDVLALHRRGLHGDALHGAAKLWAAGTDSPAFLSNLAGDLNRDAFLRMRGEKSDQAHLHSQCAVDAYKEATVAAPNCLETAVSFVALLLELNMYSQAEEEIMRAGNIHDFDDPALHHVHYDLEVKHMNMSPQSQDRINIAKLELNCVVGKFEALREDAIRHVMSLLCSPEAEAAAAEVAMLFPLSAQAQYLTVHVQVYPVQTLSRDDPKRIDTLCAAVNRMRLLSTTFPSSLAICFHFAKLLVAVGDYDAADFECRRGFLIDSPEHPDVCDFPLVSNVGKDYSDRVLAGRTNISELLRIVDTSNKWNTMTDTEKKSLLSVNSEHLIQYFASANAAAAQEIEGALCHFKERNTWNIWICPIPGCGSFTGDYFPGGNSEMFCRHILVAHQFQFPDTDTPSSVVLAHGLHSSVSICQESDEPFLCFGGFDDMVHSLLLLSSGVKPSSFEEMRTELVRKIPENLVQESDPPPEKLLQLFVASAFDLRRLLLPLLSLFKWEQVKKPSSLDPLADFGWSFSELSKIPIGSSTIQIRDDEKKSNDYYNALIDVDNPLSEDKQEQLTITYPPSFNILDLDDFELTSMEYKSASSENRNIIHQDEKGSFDLFSSFVCGDLIDFGAPDPTSIQHQSASVGNLENSNIIQKDLKESFDPLADLGWGSLIEQLSKSSDTDPQQIYSPGASGERQVESEAKDAGHIWGVQSEKIDGEASNQKGRTVKQSLMYATPSRTKPTAPSEPDEDWRKPFDIYASEHVHKDYNDKLKKCAPAHLCSGCFFGINKDVEVNPRIHYTKVHGIFGFCCKWEGCSAKFITKSALQFHCKFCHKEEKPG